jgi:NADPH:quinone reductase-like Zn-dependent oxidoreductase
MKAAWYERQGAARDVLAVGEMEDPVPGAGEVRIRVAFSGVNPGDVKKREDAFRVGMPYPRVIPHSDGSGTVDSVGEGVRSTGLVLWGAVISSVRNCRRVHCRSLEASGSAARKRAAGTGCLPGHSRHNGSSGCSCRRFSEGQNSSGPLASLCRNHSHCSSVRLG